jgi:hypothetical protein
VAKGDSITCPAASYDILERGRCNSNACILERSGTSAREIFEPLPCTNDRLDEGGVDSGVARTRISTEDDEPGPDSPPSNLHWHFVSNAAHERVRVDPAEVDLLSLNAVASAVLAAAFALALPAAAFDVAEVSMKELSDGSVIEFESSFCEVVVGDTLPIMLS